MESNDATFVFESETNVNAQLMELLKAITQVHRKDALEETKRWRLFAAVLATVLVSSISLTTWTFYFVADKAQAFADAISALALK